MATVTVKLTLDQAKLVQSELQERSKELWFASKDPETGSAADCRKVGLRAQSIDRVLTEAFK
jgi:hypothetical protein